MFSFLFHLQRGHFVGGCDAPLLRRAQSSAHLKKKTKKTQIRDGDEQALVCLSNREIVDASRRRTFQCKLENNRCFL